MNDDVLISAAELLPHEDEVRRRAAALEGQHAVYMEDLEHPAYGAAFCRSLLFEHWSELLEQPLSADQIFYNQYFWFLRAITIYQEQNGKDAGMEQGAYQMIERADYDVVIDWELLEKIDNRARGGQDP